jgi:hypothetical protein
MDREAMALEASGAGGSVDAEQEACALNQGVEGQSTCHPFVGQG